MWRESWVVRCGSDMVNRHSYTFIKQHGQTAMYNWDVRARRQALPRANIPHSLGFHRDNCALRTLDLTKKEESGWMLTGGNRRIDLSVNIQVHIFFRPVPQAAMTYIYIYYFFLRGVIMGTDWN